ncbi:hypothetical protein V2A60_004028 [Cordyceps javanica]
MLTKTATAADLVRHVLLGLETCIVVLAMLHSAHAALTAGRLQSLQCSVSGHCEDDEQRRGDEAMSLVSSGLALAILSSVVLLARLALLQLRHFPRSVGLLYDVLMGVLWALGLAQLVLLAPRATTMRNLSSDSDSDSGGGNSVVVDAGDGGRVVILETCWRVRGVALAAAAVALHTGRMLLELALVCLVRRRTARAAPPPSGFPYYRPIEQDDEWEAEKGHWSAPPQAYSPVLAFFPDD